MRKTVPESKNIMGNFAFLRFAIFPLLVLFTMNGMLDLFIQDIGKIGTSEATLSTRYQITQSTLVTLSEGRFRFMTFFFVATFLYPGFAFLSLYLIKKYTRSLLFLVILGIGIAASALWIYYSLIEIPMPKSTELLFSITRDIALSRYDSSFATYALMGARIHFALALIATFLAVLAGCCVMIDIDARHSLTYEKFSQKRGDLKFLLIGASIFLTFMAIYVSEWVRWPANFVTSAAIAPNTTATGHAEEIRQLANGLRLYFGTGYSFTMLAFAIPAIATYSVHHKKYGDKRVKERDEFLLQVVFRKEEISVLLSIFAPMILPVAASAIGL